MNHGTQTMYRRRGCRCAVCVGYMRARWREEGRSKRQQQPKKYRTDTRLRMWKVRGVDLTWLGYQSLIRAQFGRCLFCRKSESVLRPDHNHDTGEIRGLLCNLCN